MIKTMLKGDNTTRIQTLMDMGISYKDAQKIVKTLNINSRPIIRKIYYLFKGEYYND